MPEDSVSYYSGIIENNVAVQEASDYFKNSSHNLIPDNYAIEENLGYPDWILPVFIVVFMILAWVRVYHIKRLKLLVNAFRSRLYIVHILRESDSLMIGLSFALNFVFFIVASLFVYLVSSYFNIYIPFKDVVNPIFIFSVALVLLYAGKSFVLWSLGIIFKEREKFYEYNYHVFLFNKILGIVLLPVVIAICYSKIGTQYLIYSGLFLILIIYLFRIYRGVTICIRDTNLTQYYIFLYLCTLEILPMVIITRFISTKI